MTAPCAGGGTSSAKAGFGETVVASAAVFANMFLNSPSPWAAALSGAMAATAYDLSTMCIADPPALVVPNALEWAQFVGTSTPLVVGPPAQVIVNFFAYYAWYAFCKCDAGAQPVASAATEPAGTPQLNPPVPGVASAACATSSNSRTNVTAATLSYQVSDWLPSGATSAVVTVSVVAGTTAPGFDLLVLVQQHLASGAQIGPNAGGYAFRSTTPTVFTVPIVTGAAFFEVTLSDTSFTGGTDTVTCSVAYYCNGGGPSGPTGCCPPDPTLMSQLSTIMKMVTLIQRQSAPFAYVYGTNHVGLTGNGSFAVSSLIGVSVDITTIPAWKGNISGTPVEYFDLGFVTLGTADGYETSRRLDHDGTLMIPPQAGVFTTVGYTLPPGVVVSIRELVREP